MGPQNASKSLRAAGIRFKNPCEFWSGLGRGSRGAPWRNEGPMMQGRRSAPWQSQGYGLRRQTEPDLRADAAPPTPQKRGRRRLTALEVLQAKSAFCRSQRIFLEAGMFLGKICGSLAPALMKGAAKCFLSDHPRILKVQGRSRWRMSRPAFVTKDWVIEGGLVQAGEGKGLSHGPLSSLA